MLGLAVRRRMRLQRLRIRRLEAEAAGAINRADKHLQEMQSSRRLEAVRMGGDAAHGVEGDRPTDKALVALAVNVGPGLVYLDRFVKGSARDFGRKSPDGCGRNAGLFGNRLRRVSR